MVEEKKTASSDTPTTPPPPVIVPTTNEERLLSTVGYISLGLLPVALKPKSEFCQFHGKQAAALFGSFIFLLFVFGWIISPTLGFLVFLGYFAMLVIVMFRTYKGEKWVIPVIGQLAQKIDLNKISLPLNHTPGTATDEAKKPESKPADEDKTPAEATGDHHKKS